MAIGDLVYTYITVAAGGSIAIQPASGVRWKALSFLPNSPGATDLSLQIYQGANLSSGATLSVGVLQPLYNMIMDNDDYIAVYNAGSADESGMFIGIEVA